MQVIGAQLASKYVLRSLDGEGRASGFLYGPLIFNRNPRVLSMVKQGQAAEEECEILILKYYMVVSQNRATLE